MACSARAYLLLQYPGKGLGERRNAKNAIKILNGVQSGIENNCPGQTNIEQI